MNTTMQAQFPMDGTQGFADPSFAGFSMQQPWLKYVITIQTKSLRCRLIVVLPRTRSGLKITFNI